MWRIYYILQKKLKAGRLSYVDSFTMYDNDEIYVGNIIDYSNVKIAVEEEVITRFNKIKYGKEGI